ncbi:Uncharacterized protein FWK35_00021072 [Aphis craccivora]|uniref:Uncharacterized protein n=1 Tax=Aphis craccivora TaxID=307492 RepID=A0A6G0Z8G5_APHCR|nr:Uncharacterized protein FWK35_00021072 [Aphis craccivora]
MVSQFFMASACYSIALDATFCCGNADDADRNGNNNIIMTMIIITAVTPPGPNRVCRRPGGGEDGRLSSPRLVYYILHYYYYHGYIHERNSGAHSIRRRHPFEIAATRRSPRPFSAHRRQCAGYARRLLMTVVRCAVRFNRHPTICGIDVHCRRYACALLVRFRSRRSFYRFRFPFTKLDIISPSRLAATISEQGEQFHLFDILLYPTTTNIIALDFIFLDIVRTTFPSPMYQRS